MNKTEIKEKEKSQWWCIKIFMTIRSCAEMPKVFNRIDKPSSSISKKSKKYNLSSTAA